MGIDFLNPLFLLLIPVLLAIIIFISNSLNRKGMQRNNGRTFIRGLVIIILVLALSGTGITWIVKDISTIFLIDTSDSMANNKELTESFTKEALDAMTDKDKAGVIVFGEDPVMESFISKEPAFGKITYIPEGNYTNIEKAITTAISLLPEKNRKRIVLITDGEENQGDSSKVAGLIKEKNIDFKVLKIEKEKINDLAITKLSTPAKVNKNEEYSINVNIKSNFSTKGTLTLFDGNDKAIEEIVEISKGDNRFVFNDKSNSIGFKTYRAVIEADGDKESRNNEASSIINILDEPVILLLEGEGSDGEEISKMLEALNANYKRVDASLAPSNFQSLIQYKSIILSNVSAEKLSSGFLDALEPYVKDFAGGLIAIAGDDSFALGGYSDTSLEKVLPVSMELKGEKAIPDMCIILVIDKSGSMSDGSGGVTRIELAKEAASRVLDSVRKEDSIGVLAFDNAMYWVVEPQKAGNKEEIRNMIGSIRAGGGTSILPPLKESVKTIKSQKSTIKHIILLTDGQAEKTGYDNVLEEAENANITVSTVAVGRDADSNLLQYISEKAQGRFYQTDEFSNLPKIFAKETYMATRSYLNNRDFTPRIISLHPMIADIASKGLPVLRGYIASSPKDTARVLLESDEEDPILSLWQYGLGKTVAWNSDMNGKWSANYIKWEDNLSMWNNIINWTVESYEDNELQIDTYTEGGTAYINVKQNNNKEELNTKAIITTPSLNSMEIELYAAAPGQYAGNFNIKEIGPYLIKIMQSDDGEIKRTLGTGLTVAYSPEYDIEAKSEKLDRLVYESQGKYIDSPKEIYKGDIENVRGRRDLTPFLLVMALIIFLLDIAIRRLSLPFEKLRKIFNKIFKKLRVKRIEKKEATLKMGKHVEKEFDITEEKVYSDKGEDKASKSRTKEKAKKNDTLDTRALLKRKRQK